MQHEEIDTEEWLSSRERWSRVAGAAVELGPGRLAERDLADAEVAMARPAMRLGIHTIVMRAE